MHRDPRPLGPDQPEPSLAAGVRQLRGGAALLAHAARLGVDAGDARPAQRRVAQAPVVPLRGGVRGAAGGGLPQDALGLGARGRG